MADNSVDAVVSDPPAGINFMQKKFDSDRGGRTQWVAWLAEIMAEAKRVTRPGGHALIWALPRTSHWTALALEDAGWEVREKLYHCFGSGFPKSQDVSKAIDLDAFTKWLTAHRPQARGWTRRLWNATNKDKWAWKWCELAAERWGGLVGKRQVVGQYIAPDGSPRGIDIGIQGGKFAAGEANYIGEKFVTAPATDAARQWQGWGTSTKPAVEEWILCRKPLAAPTVAAQVLATGTGALNVDACRVETSDNTGRPQGTMPHPMDWGNKSNDGETTYSTQSHPSGRWPSNLLLSHSPGCVRVGVKRVKGSDRPGHEGRTSTSHIAITKPVMHSSVRHADADGMEQVDAWECVEGCPIRILGEQAGERRGATSNSNGATSLFANGHAGSNSAGHGDTSANVARFFPNFPPADDDEPRIDVPFYYAAKASRAERERGLEGLKPSFMATMNDGIGKRPHNPEQPTAWVKNSHPTVKSVSLCKWLCKLICRPGGIVLDPFAGSGSIGVAAIAEGMQYVGIEMDAEYCKIAEARLKWAEAQAAKQDTQQLRLAV